MPAENPRIHRYINCTRIRFGTRSIGIELRPDGGYYLQWRRMLAPDEAAHALTATETVLRGRVLVTTVGVSAESIEMLSHLLVDVIRNPLRSGPDALPSPLFPDVDVEEILRS